MRKKIHIPKNSLSLNEIRQLEFLQVAEFARLFNHSSRLVYKRIEAGIIKKVKIGSLTRIHHSQIDEYSRYLLKMSGHNGAGV
jgi:excisionase family DNA binding protein